jgi:hypothetical protein
VVVDEAAYYAGGFGNEADEEGAAELGEAPAELTRR